MLDIIARWSAWSQPGSIHSSLGQAPLPSFRSRNWPSAESHEGEWRMHFSSHFSYDAFNLLPFYWARKQRLPSSSLFCWHHRFLSCAWHEVSTSRKSFSSMNPFFVREVWRSFKVLVTIEEEGVFGLRKRVTGWCCFFGRPTTKFCLCTSFDVGRVMLDAAENG